MDDKILEIIELLSSLLEDCPYKVKVEVEVAIEMLKKYVDSEKQDVEDLIQVQDQLEMITNMSNLDSFSRSEILTIISDIENII